MSRHLIYPVSVNSAESSADSKGIFPADGTHPYKRDLKTLEFHLLDTGHFALEEDGDVITGHIRSFLAKHVEGGTRRVTSE